MWSLVAASALASGFAVGEPGAAALARGGASVALADDPTAAWSNPAALAEQATVPHVELALVAAGARFSPLDGPDASTGTHLTPIPNVVVPLPRTPLWLAAGPPLTGARWEWPADGPQRYAVIAQSVIATDAVIGAAIAPRAAGGKLAFGLSVGGTAVDLHERQAITTALDGSLDPAYDVVSTLDARGFAPAAILGVRAGRFGPVTLAATARLPSRAALHGTLTSDFSANTFHTGGSSFGQLITDPSATDDDVLVPLSLPGLYRLGVAHTSDRLEVELVVGLDDWSGSRAIAVTEVDLVIPTAAAEDPVVTEDITVPLGLGRSSTARLGATWRPGGSADDRSLSAGISFSSSAAPANTRTALVPDGHRYGFGFGGTNTLSDGAGFLSGARVTWAVSPQIVRSAPNDSSVVAQVAIDPLSGAVGLGQRVGNGRIDAWSTTFALGISPAAR